ncbi:MAG: manganese-dependent inorganic pyrophosphatase [Rickettsiales bacterium]|jgi:manganese-dependent inorganic pyrophosphatase|nr:manganese-dependent inorganic pyrophosphatase [Rickettsiales bacterium]
MSIMVFGHSAPDTDSVVSAIAAAYLIGGEPYVQGEIQPEAEFVLEKFGLETPKRLESVAGADVALVDTTEPSQLPDDIAEANVKYVFDHHNLGGLKTRGAFEGWFMPVGCSSTVLRDYAECEGRELPVNLAGAMLCAILSDTVLFKSPTTTDADKTAAEKLAKIAGIEDYNALGMEMLRVKSAIGDKTADDLIGGDYKEIEINGKMFGTGQIELVDASMADRLVPAIRARLEELKNKKGYFGMIFLITDIMREGSRLFVFSDDDAKVAAALHADLNDHEAWVDGLMSRKKQIVIPLGEKI